VIVSGLAPRVGVVADGCVAGELPAIILSICRTAANSDVMCNFYSMIRNRQAIRELTRAMHDRTANLPPLPGIFPDYAAIVRNTADGRELAMARWGMPSPAFALKGRSSDPGVTDVRNTASPHWRRRLAPECSRVVPFTSFSENETLRNGSNRRSGSRSMKAGRWHAPPVYG
jgi:putative SOS response-associated peptidase YedK